MKGNELSLVWLYSFSALLSHLISKMTYLSPFGYCSQFTKLQLSSPKFSHSSQTR